MGKNTIITPQQKKILQAVAQNTYLCDRFYFTGGTALSAAYLHHRKSVDLDFFSEQSLDTQ